MRKNPGTLRSAFFLAILIVAIAMAAVTAEATMLQATVEVPLSMPASSNTLSISDIANLAEVVLPPDDIIEGEEDWPVPEGAMRLAINWLGGSDGAPEQLIALVAGSGTPLKVELTKENNWKQVITLPEGFTFPTYTLLGVQQCKVNTTKDTVTFDVSDVFEALPPEEELPEDIIEPVDASGVSCDVTMYASRDGAALADGEPVYFGDTIHLCGQLENPDGLDHTLQWQVDTGSGWQPVEGANTADHVYTLTEESLSSNFRLLMTVALPSTP